MDFFTKQIDSWIENLSTERNFITNGCISESSTVDRGNWEDTEFVEVVYHDIKSVDSCGRKIKDVFVRYVEKE